MFDINGVIYKPKSDYEFDINVAVEYTTGITQQNNTPLILQSSKKLLVKRSISSVDYTNILANPAFTTELNRRMTISHQEHIEDIDHEESQIYQTIRGHLDKHPDFVRLADSQKEELYHKVLGLR